FFFSSRRRHTRFSRDWSSDVCSSDLGLVTYQSNLIHICERRRGYEEALRQRNLSLDPSQIAEIRFGNIEHDIPARINKLLNDKRSEERRVGKECRYRKSSVKEKEQNV